MLLVVLMGRAFGLLLIYGWHMLSLCAENAARIFLQCPAPQPRPPCLASGGDPYAIKAIHLSSINPQRPPPQMLPQPQQQPQPQPQPPPGQPLTQQSWRASQQQAAPPQPAAAAGSAGFTGAHEGVALFQPLLQQAQAQAQQRMGGSEPLLPGLPYIQQLPTQPAQQQHLPALSRQQPEQGAQAMDWDDSSGAGLDYVGSLLPRTQRPPPPSVYSSNLDPAEAEAPSLAVAHQAAQAQRPAPQPAPSHLARQQLTAVAFQQPPPSVATGSRRVSQIHEAYSTAGPGTAAPAGAAASARRLSFEDSSASGPGSALGSAAGSRSGSSSAEAGHAAAGRRPATPALAVRQWSHLLTQYEQSEILAYREVWFVGRRVASKVQGE